MNEAPGMVTDAKKNKVTEMVTEVMGVVTGKVTHAMKKVTGKVTEAITLRIGSSTILLVIH